MSHARVRRVGRPREDSVAGFARLADGRDEVALRDDASSKVRRTRDRHDTRDWVTASRNDDRASGARHFVEHFEAPHLEAADRNPNLALGAHDLRLSSRAPVLDGNLRRELRRRPMTVPGPR